MKSISKFIALKDIKLYSRLLLSLIRKEFTEVDLSATFAQKNISEKMLIITIALSARGTCVANARIDLR
jgi:hypothetical protein